MTKLYIANIIISDILLMKSNTNIYNLLYVLMPRSQSRILRITQIKLEYVYKNN